MSSWLNKIDLNQKSNKLSIPYKQKCSVQLLILNVMKTLLRKLCYILMFVGVNFGMNSCIVVREAPAKPRTVIILKRSNLPPSHPRHPHGGPPGQTKKHRGHPGKRL